MDPEVVKRTGRTDVRGRCGLCFVCDEMEEGRVLSTELPSMKLGIHSASTRTDATNGIRRKGG